MNDNYRSNYQLLSENYEIAHKYARYTYARHNNNNVTKLLYNHIPNPNSGVV